jgi:pyridoxamine 5'-phosphate oxidase
MSLRHRRVQYETAGLEREDLAGDPVVQWHRWYDDAVAAGLAEPNAMTVATIGTDGLPDARLVLVRDVDQRGLTFFSNYASTKGRQLDAAPVAAAVFGWLELHRQVRVRGPVRRVDDAESDDYFASRPRGHQLGAWASPQSEVIPDRGELERRVAEAEARFPGEVPRPPGWGGWRIEPVSYEFWQGRPSRLHDRFRYTRIDTADGPGWEIHRLAP